MEDGIDSTRAENKPNEWFVVREYVYVIMKFGMNSRDAPPLFCTLYSYVASLQILMVNPLDKIHDRWLDLYGQSVDIGALNAGFRIKLINISDFHYVHEIVCITEDG